MPETKDLYLRHPQFEDWQDMYHNVWSREESARYMLWEVTRSEDAAKERMERSIAYQQNNPTCWFVYEKNSGQAIGFAGMKEITEGVWEDTGIALGPDFTGHGCGKQLLNALTEYARQTLKAKKFIASCRSENTVSRNMILACGFFYIRSEERTDPRCGEAYTLEIYEKCL